jgi:hypothetical protein
VTLAFELVIPAKAGIQLFVLMCADLKGKSFRCLAAGNFLSGDKKSPKNTCFVRRGYVREGPSLALRGPRASCARSPSSQRLSFRRSRRGLMST